MSMSTNSMAWDINYTIPRRMVVLYVAILKDKFKVFYDHDKQIVVINMPYAKRNIEVDLGEVEDWSINMVMGYELNRVEHQINKTSAINKAEYLGFNVSNDMFYINDWRKKYGK